jgi:hypothetical protein
LKNKERRSATSNVAEIVLLKAVLAAAEEIRVPVAVGATISLLARPGAGAVWTQSAALLLCAPASLAGDWTRRRKRATAG